MEEAGGGRNRVRVEEKNAETDGWLEEHWGMAWKSNAFEISWI